MAKLHAHLPKYPICGGTGSSLCPDFQFPAAPEFVVLAEGELEPRSAGSYTLRVYGGISDKFPTDDFVTGLVRTRNGIIEAVQFYDVDGDDKPEIVVTIRSVGTGGYVSADAFRHRPIA